jgi:hypothetical protein
VRAAQTGRPGALCGRLGWTGVVGRDHHAFWPAVVFEVAVATSLAARYGRTLRHTGVPAAYGAAVLPR